jgi:hypothetical protein
MYASPSVKASAAGRGMRRSSSFATARPREQMAFGHPREFTIVTNVGSIDPGRLHDLEVNFGEPNLAIETGKKARKSR